MAPKRQSPLEELPVAASSSSEEESEEEIEDEEDESAEEKASIPSSSVKKPTAKVVSTPSLYASTQPQSSSDEEEGSDSDPDSGNPRLLSASAGFKIKPITSKPMDKTDELKKPAPKSSVIALAAPTKSVTKKKKVSDADEEEGFAKDTGKKSGGDPKKQLFQRLWSEDDEIVILKGMLDYTKKGGDLWADVNAFHDFIKKSLHVDVSKDQLINKLRRLKKKYQNNAGKGKKGEDRTFTKPHEQMGFELSKKIWGGEGTNGGDDQVKANGKAKKKQKVRDDVAFPKPEVLAVPEVLKAEEGLNWSQYPYLRESLQFGKKLNVFMPSFEESIAKEGLGKIGNSKAKELEEKWRKLKVTEIEFYLKWVELMQEQMKLTLGAVNASKP